MPKASPPTRRSRSTKRTPSSGAPRRTRSAARGRSAPRGSSVAATPQRSPVPAPADAGTSMMTATSVQPHSSGAPAAPAAPADTVTFSREQLSEMIGEMVQAAVAAAVPAAVSVPSTSQHTSPGAPLDLRQPATAVFPPQMGSGGNEQPGVQTPQASRGSAAHALGLGRPRPPSTIAALLSAALAPATARAYHAIWAELRNFLRRSASDSLFPVSVDELACFIASRYDAGSAAATLSSVVSAISYGHKVHGLADPSTNFRIRQMLTGARRLRPSRDMRTAITLPELGQLCNALRQAAMSPLERSAFHAIFTLAFFALLRPGEVVRCGRQEHFLRMGGVRLQHRHLFITIPSSKTSQTPVTFQLEERSDLPECPVAAVRSYLLLRGAGHQHEALFVGDGRRPITGNQLNRALRQTSQIAGLSRAHLSGHCLRIGGASHGAIIGMTEVQLSQAGRWSSQAMHRYVRRHVSVLRATPQAPAVP
ncbi:uncharacterized protein LOC122391889 isoform X2 [Amphibalanus amphitrite]|nr:uncharacterized protein LOC122391889 isoform X2 [Amphibalanus amphitrite]